MRIYAHRGASADFPEHTMQAYQGAVDQGADGFECDVRLSKDGIPVLWHNSSMLERAGNDGLIAEMDFRQIKIAYPEVLTLDLLVDFAIEKKKGLLIETKHPVISGNKVEEVVVDILNKKCALSKIDVSVMSFSWMAIEKIKRLDSRISTTLLIRDSTPRFAIRTSSAQKLGPGMRALKADLDFYKEQNRELNVWTVDDVEGAELCNELNVSVLITNKPAHIRSSLG